MGAFYETIPDSLAAWILKQKVFWVATAPLSGDGHINISPKGGTQFGLLDATTFWYMDLTGSGSETMSHLYERHNGRITVLFNAFEGPPRILRLYGRGTVLESGTVAYEAFVARHGVETQFSSRSVNVVRVHQVGTSCGYSVPCYDFREFRSTLYKHFEKKEEKFVAGKTDESMPRYWAFKNAWSVDGLPSMKLALRTGESEGIEPMKKMVGPNALTPRSYRRQVDGYTMDQLALAFIMGLVISAVLFAYGERGVEALRTGLTGSGAQIAWPSAST